MIEPRVIIGAAVYNHDSEAREAFESLLGQTCRDFALVVVDDGSTDATPAIAEEYARRDPRVTVHRNERRLGMIENWRRAFHLARGRYPRAEYFAWASDHDLWHPRWLSVLVGELDRHPEAALAYPLNAKVRHDGRLADRKPWYFDTAGVTDPRKRLRLTGWNMSAGNMIYGLFRIEPLVRAGVFRRVLVPDRMLLTELSLHGQFRQVRQILWLRRWYGRVYSLSRQRVSLFPNGRPLHAYLPWWLSHTIAFAWQLVVRGTGRPVVGRGAGVRLTWQHLCVALPVHAGQQAAALRSSARARGTVLRDRYRRTVRMFHNGASGAYRRLAALGRRAGKRVKKLIDEAIRIPGVALLKAVRSIPFVRSRAIPWLLREEISQIPSARAVIALKKDLRRVAAAEGPILVGPWLGEVGFELLYWIPFLNWATREYGLSRDRLIVLSRGGAECWYRDLCARSVDIFDLFTPEQYRQKNAERWSDGGNQKQYDLSEFDHQVVALVRDRLQEASLTPLHPSVMYRLFRYYWYEKGAITIQKDHSDFRPLPAVGPPPADLPDEYVAVRFYFRPSFPDTEENRRFVTSIIRGISRRIPVVLLNTGLVLDDHEDFTPDSAAGVYRVDHLMVPNRNLETQSAIIAHARALVGTYGGLSYLGPFYGVPAIGVYSDDRELVATHQDVTGRLCRALQSPLVVMNTTAAGVLGLVFADLAARPGLTTHH